MKKRNIFLCFLFAILASLSLGVHSRTTANTHAVGTVTITLDSNGGECSVSELQTNESGTLTSIPEATQDNYIFAGWLFNDELVTNKTVFTENSTITALFYLKTHYYNISSDGSTFTIIGKTLNIDCKYTLSDTCESLESAILLIKSDLILASTPTTLNFDNISLDQNLDLNIESLTLTGNITLNEFSINYNTPKHNSHLSLNNLELTASSNQNLVNITGNNRVIVDCSNTIFNTSSSENNYALFIDNSSTSLSFASKLAYQSKFLYNHNTGTSTSANNLDLSSHTSGKIAITVPFYEDGSVILTTNLNASNFEFIPLQSNYTCSIVTNGNYLHSNVEFKLKFNANGGTPNNFESEMTINYNPYTAIAYPDSDNLSKTHSTLNGFAGKITLTNELMELYNIDDPIWYFDKITLNQFLTADAEYKDIPNYFSKTLPVANNNGFTYYNYDNSFEDLNFQAVTLMLDLGLTPEFFALWSDTIYNINFETNGGSAVAPISGVFNSSVTLPTTSKPGFTFDGWYLSEDLSTESSVNASNFNTMPDTEPTLYAKWTANGINLIIYPNNGLNEITKVVPFESSLSNVSELTEANFTKTGYSFAGWYTNSSLDEATKITDLETFTMPNEELSVYAKWQINSYTITLNNNHKKDHSDFASLTAEYGDDTSSLKSSTPIFEGYTFNGWMTESKIPYTIPDTMPAEDLTLYANWSANEYKIRYIVNNSTWQNKTYHFEDTIMDAGIPIKSGYIFYGWYTTASFDEAFRLSSMPSHNIDVYAKMVPKQTIKIDTSKQTYSLSENYGFKLKLGYSLKNFKIEYLVNDKWQTDIPKDKGTYDVRISRYEDYSFNEVNLLIEGGLEIVPNTVDLSFFALLLYCLAGMEIICSIIILLLRKQRQTYLNYAVILPFGLVSTSDFIHFVISLVLAIFGFVLMIIQLTKLKKVNNDISKISTESTKYTPPDVSTNKSISNKVEILLQKEGFVKPEQYDNEIELDGSIDDEEDIIIHSQESSNDEIDKKPADDEEDIN